MKASGRDKPVETHTPLGIAGAPLCSKTLRALRVELKWYRLAQDRLAWRQFDCVYTYLAGTLILPSERVTYTLLLQMNSILPDVYNRKPLIKFHQANATRGKSRQQAGQHRVGQARARQGRPGQGRAGQGRAGRAGQGRAGHGRTGQEMAGRGRAGQDRAGHGRARQGMTWQDMAGHLCDAA